MAKELLVVIIALAYLSAWVVFVRWMFPDQKPKPKPKKKPSKNPSKK